MVDTEQLIVVPFGNDIISPSGEQRMEAFALIRISLPIRLAGLLGARIYWCKNVCPAILVDNSVESGIFSIFPENPMTETVVDERDALKTGELMVEYLAPESTRNGSFESLTVIVMYGSARPVHPEFPGRLHSS